MNSTEIISELRKIASYSTSKKEVCTQAADLIECLIKSRDNWKYEAECHHDIAVEALKDNDKTRETH